MKISSIFCAFIFMLTGQVCLIGQASAKRVAPLLTQLEFAQHVQSQMQQRWPEGSFIISQNDGDISIQVTIGEHAGEFNSMNSYRNYRDYPDSLGQITQVIISNLATFIVTSPSNKEAILLPTIKAEDWFNPSASDDERLARLHLVNDLYIVIAEDHSTYARYLQVKEIGLHGASEDINKIYHASLDNFKSRHGITLSAKLTPAGYSIEVDNKNYNSSIILLDIAWGKALNLTGEPVFAIITRDLFIIADSSNEEQLLALKALAKKMFSEAAYPISSELFHYKSGRLTVYK